MAIRSAAQRAAYARLVPKTEVYDVSTFISPVNGETYHGGVVIETAPGCRVRIGSAWAWRASELERRDDAPAR